VGLRKPLPSSKRGEAGPRRPWTDEELSDMVSSLKYQDEHKDLLLATLLLVYTGMRREELIQAKVEDFQNAEVQALKIPEGKSHAAIRTVPIHPIIQSLVAHLVANSADGYLLPTTRKAKSIGDAFGKRFVRIRREIGLTDDKINMHTLRNTFMSACENSGVPESTTQVVVGHARRSLTYGGYSPANAVKWKVLTDAVASISFGSFDKTAKETIEGIISR
jgi:integrase